MMRVPSASGEDDGMDPQPCTGPSTDRPSAGLWARGCSLPELQTPAHLGPSYSS